MDWQDDTVDGEEAGLAIDKAFTLIHEAPPALASTGQQQKATSSKHKGLEAATITRTLQLAAFPLLYKGEPEEQRLARAAAAQQCWDSLSQNIQETLEGTDAGVFQGLLSFAQQSHKPPAPTSTGGGGGGGAGQTHLSGSQRVPTGLVLAGGVNSADHCRTFPNLAAFLRQHGCYVALLQPHSFGKVPGDAIGEVLRQMSGLQDSKAEHIAALQQWYCDETAAAAFSGAGAAAVAQAGEQQQEASHPPGGGGDKQDARHLRQRQPTAADAATARQLGNRQCPLVVIVEGTESVDMLCLRDFILTVSEAYQGLPLTLVLGLTTNAAALSGLLSSEVIDRCMDLQHFSLATAMSRLDRLVQQVLLGGSGRWPGLLFSLGIINQLTDNFLNHYYSTGCITQGLRLAALHHFQAQPASSLAAAALEGPDALEEACASLPPAALAEVRRQLHGRTAAQLAASVLEAIAAWGRWAVGVHWLARVAKAVGLAGQEFTHWKLIEEASRAQFASKQLPEQLSRMVPLLKTLPAAGVQQLAAELREAAAAVYGGAEAAAEQLEQLAAFDVACLGEGAGAEAAAAGAEEDAEGQQQQQQEEQQEEEEVAAEDDGEAGAAAGTGSSSKHQRKAKARDLFHTRQSRHQALLEKSAQLAAAKGGGGTAAAAQRAKQADAPGARFAAWLAPALRELLSTLPSKLPGAAVFTCRDITALECLTAEPRQSLHAALTEPHHYLPGMAEDFGVSAAQEDACLAYRLFDQDPNCANLADWYQAFASVHEQVEQAGGGAAAGGSSAAKKKKAAVKQSKKGKAAAGGGEAAAEAAAAGEERKRRQRELAARFSQATAELQYIGLIKPAKRRRGDYVQRVVHMPALE